MTLPNVCSPKVVKVSLNDYTIFVEEYYTTKPQYLRFGQAFWNKFLSHETQVEDKLFYIEGDKAAQMIIYHNYLMEDL